MATSLQSWEGQVIEYLNLISGGTGVTPPSSPGMSTASKQDDIVAEITKLLNATGATTVSPTNPSSRELLTALGVGLGTDPATAALPNLRSLLLQQRDAIGTDAALDTVRQLLEDIKQELINGGVAGTMNAPVAGTANTTAQTVLPADATRRKIRITNYGPELIFFTFGAPASADSGMPLPLYNSYYTAYLAESQSLLSAVTATGTAGFAVQTIT